MPTSQYLPDDRRNGLPRREFLTRATMLAAAASLGCSGDISNTLAPLSRNQDNVGGQQGGDDPLPAGDKSGIEHIILIMMENRSFDHFLGWAPHADGRQAGLSYPDRNGVLQPTFALAPDFQGCSFADPDHSFDGARVQFDNGQCDGWLRTGGFDKFPIGYYRRDDLKFFGRAVPDWTIADRYFSAILGPTFPNRIFQSAAQTDRISNTANPSVLPTIWDLLLARGLTARNYFHDLPTTALWGQKYASIWRPVSSFFSDCAAGTLPQVSLIDPLFGGEAAGTSNDDHPFADIRAGEDLLNRIYAAVTKSPAWANTVLVVNYDEWGGFYDHVPPPRGSVSDSDRAAGYTDGLRGFRTPLLVVSPFARRGIVGHRVYDHTSILNMIEWRWNLPSLTMRDRTANNLAQLLQFTKPDLQATQYLVPSVTGATCPVPSPFIAGSQPAFGKSSSFDDGNALAIAGPRAATREAWRAVARANGLPMGLANAL